MKDQKWLEEFTQFVHADSQPVPAELTAKVQEKMHPLLNPSAFAVFGKVFGIHMGVGLFSLSFCHQFGLNPFQTNISLDEWFMNVGGHLFCMLACGFLFVALSLAAANYWLSIEELKVLKKNGWAQTLALGVISLMLIHLFDGEVILAMGFAWLMGGLAAGWTTNQVAWKLRTS